MSTAPQPEPIVGIDLGTTYSLVAIAGYPAGASADERAPRVIPDEHGRALCPSVVRYDPGAPPVVGYGAKDDAEQHPLTTIASVKRLMGRSLSDAAGDVRYLPYRVVQGPHDTARVALPDGRVLSPQEVSAAVLSHLRDQAQRVLGVDVTKAVVTVPAYFDDAQRQATRDAGRLAGLDVVRIVSEPTAAALAYGLGLGRSSTPQNVVIYDLGGGTFDVSVLRITPGAGAGADAFEVLAASGDTRLGGDDFDHAIIELLTRSWGLDAASLSPGERRALHTAAERAKIELSSADVSTVSIMLGATARTRTITRAQFESAIDPLVKRTITICQRALRDARRKMGDEPIGAVVLVGGSTRVPMVARRVGEHFALPPYGALDPDRVVALGAAVQASILSGASRDALLLDVIPLSLGIETAGGAVAKIIFKNSTVPASASELFSTSVDGQRSIKLHVLQGEREMVSDCRSLGTFHLIVPPMPAGVPQLRVTFLVDANGVLSVQAIEQRSGKRAQIQIVPNHGLSREEVERIELESFRHARSDMARHRVVDLIANSELDLHWTRTQLTRHEGKLDEPTLTPLRASIAVLERFIADAKSDWASVDPDAFNRAKDALDRAGVRLHEVAITESLKGQQGRADER